MKINEVMKETGLTKKAIYYYENEGLIKPKKDPENNYRIYTEEDVRRLITINILRRLDVPIKAIGDIISNSVSMKDILKEQLVLTNQKINMLFQSKMIMNDLITKDIEERDFSFNTLKEFNFELDKIMAGTGYLGTELGRVFPGTLGKMLAIFYNDFLNVPLDTDEKVSAWNDLVKKLDEMKEIDYPADIRNIIDEMYGEADEDRLAQISKRVIKEQLERQSPPDQASILMAEEALEGYYGNPENQKKIEGYYKLQSFILSNLDMFKEIDKYISIINDDYSKYRNLTLKASRTE
ncbi:MAG TPA: MerR family transcriptional regulator [Anaerovoracaceae bacterium]|nr:MerR family transcriptional regulator [Anaerovoracaceae bacterium]